jgi:hypothetical protein
MYSPEYLAETRVPQALVAVILCPVLALCSVVLRLYTRGFLLKRVFWDDYVIIMAMVSDLVFVELETVQEKKKKFVLWLISGRLLPS